MPSATTKMRRTTTSGTHVPEDREEPAASRNEEHERDRDDASWAGPTGNTCAATTNIAAKATTPTTGHAEHIGRLSSTQRPEIEAAGAFHGRIGATHAWSEPNWNRYTM